LIRSAFAKGRDLLRGNLLFSGLSDEDADAILASAHRTRYPARATIFAKGAPGQSMMAILQGRVRISVPSSEGREAVFKIMGEGEIFGEIALLDGKDRTANAVAITACELFACEKLPCRCIALPSVPPDRRILPDVSPSGRIFQCFLNCPSANNANRTA
jgi:CRP-like cAMP-binding protein